VAAPTAGLHLTQAVIEACRARGIGFATIELAVGLDTFRPVTVEDPDDHPMHSEAYRVSEATWEACGATRRAGGRVVAVGTTTARALESVALGGARQGRTELFIRPPHRFAVVDVLLTNFHLPRSTLLLLVEAFTGPRWRQLYGDALAAGYRFLSFGDAMLLSRA
jgi:S-adenosylmethionine:tRNA ribosyltransferase-isomerase